MMKTADGYDQIKIADFYWLDKLNDRVVQLHRSTLKFAGEKVFTKSGKDFNLITESIYISDLFASVSEANNALNEYRKRLVEYYENEIAVKRRDIEGLKRQIKQYEENNSPYHKPSSDKKAEKVGSVKI